MWNGRKYNVVILQKREAYFVLNGLLTISYCFMVANKTNKQRELNKEYKVECLMMSMYLTWRRKYGIKYFWTTLLSSVLGWHPHASMELSLCMEDLHIPSMLMQVLILYGTQIWLMILGWLSKERIFKIVPAKE